MAIRRIKPGWAALAIGVLLLGGAAHSARADDCDECSDGHGWRRMFSWCKGGSCRGGCFGRGHGGYGGNGSFVAVNGPYCDPRDRELYSAPGYNVPVAVPLAPVVKHTYHYGWGLPSSRLVRVGARYNQWYPTTPFSQNGGYLTGGIYPTIYQPTDTTQLGAYHVHAPRWGRFGGYGY